MPRKTAEPSAARAEKLKKAHRLPTIADTWNNAQKSPDWRPPSPPEDSRITSEP